MSWILVREFLRRYSPPFTVYETHPGGYQVCEKWLKDRKGRPLTEDDLAHYQKIVVASQKPSASWQR
jgi:hypothetical protein